MRAKTPIALTCAALLWPATVLATSQPQLGVRICPGQAASDRWLGDLADWLEQISSRKD